jgi:putative methionine-R-sulfoxide reductase with GAF domain
MSADLSKFYSELLRDVKATIDGEPDFIANASNIGSNYVKHYEYTLGSSSIALSAPGPGKVAFYETVGAVSDFLFRSPAAALVYHGLNSVKDNKINWAGFYFEKAGQLVLGPFQGANLTPLGAF